jgi:hypothetical protein
MAGSQDPNGLDAPDPRALGAKPPDEDPRELARRLAAEAMAKRNATKQTEDPRALARRLATEAKAKRDAETKAAGLAGAAPPPGRVVAEIPSDDKPKKKRKKKRKKTGRAAAAPKPTAAAAAPRVSLIDRAGASRQMSAQEALAAALAQEDTAPAAAPVPTAAKPALAKRRKPKRKRSAETAPAAETPAADEQPAAGTHDAGGVVIEVFSTAEIRKILAVSNRDVFRALWQAHKIRAVHEGDLGLAATATVLLDAADRLPEDGLSAVRVRLGDRDHAMWIDTSRGVLLGIASPPEIYLAGL